MNNTSQRQYAPLLPYSETIFDNFKIYDAVRYKVNINMIDKDSIMLHQASMIKYYRCENVAPVPIGGD